MDLITPIHFFMFGNLVIYVLFMLFNHGDDTCVYPCDVLIKSADILKNVDKTLLADTTALAFFEADSLRVDSFDASLVYDEW